MASTTALLTGLTGLTSNAARLEVIGNNISNVNTNSFKSSRAVFASTFSRSLGLGTGPTGVNGGTNPSQIGLGVSIAGTQRNFTSGSISPTGINTDIAIEGGGFFAVQRGSEQLYTRNGSFILNSANELVNQSGDRILGFGTDSNFNIIAGQVAPLSIPVGTLTIAEATQNVFFAGNLDVDNKGLPTQGSLLLFDQPFNDQATSTPLAGPATLLLGNLEDPANLGTALFPVGGEPYTISISGAKKGEKVVPAGSLSVDATTTLQDYLDFIDDVYGVASGLTNPDGAIAGAQYNPATGVVSVVGNAGSFNDLTLIASNLTMIDTTGAPITNPFSITQNGTTGLADGESIRTSFIVYDSLGTPLTVDMTLAFDSASSTGTTWRYFLDTPDKIDPTDPSISLGTGLVQFDTSGQLLTQGGIQMSLPRVGTGAESPTPIKLNFINGDNAVTALVDTDSSLGAISQDGSPIGTLKTFSVGSDGVITGGFSNGLTRSLGQISVATFTNAAGLVESGNNLFRVGANSGSPLVTTAGQFGTGKMVGGALELSNVDLGQQFIEMILTTTGYSASSRVITTADQLLQQLVQIVR
jgi:flagellar hook protein FlgE